MDKQEFIPQKKYNKILKLMPVVCVDVCIIKKDDPSKVLLAKRNNEPCKGQWYIVGGRVIKGEELEETAYRKAKEETGLECKIGRIIHVENAIYDTGINGIPTHNVNICFIATPIHNNKHIVLNADNSDIKWVDRHEAKTMDLHPYVLNSINNATGIM